MTQREYEDYRKQVDAIDNRCCCCRLPVYECPSWIASNPVDPAPGDIHVTAPMSIIDRELAAASSDAETTAELDPPDHAPAGLTPKRKPRRSKSDST